MTTMHDPGHGFTVLHDGQRETIAADMGGQIRLANKGMQGTFCYTPEEAREVAAALTTWADQQGDGHEVLGSPECEDCQEPVTPDEVTESMASPARRILCDAHTPEESEASA